MARAEELRGASERYDGALSDFGALNCVEELAAVSRGLAAAVRPGGLVAICVIGRFCLWETLYYAVRLQPGKALRRVRHRAVMTSLEVRVHYRSMRELRAAFSPHFECRRWMGIGVLVPPSYVALPRWLAQCLGSDATACSRDFRSCAALPITG